MIIQKALSFFKQKILIIKYSIYIDKNERAFINKNSNKFNLIKNSSKIILVQMAKDYFFLLNAREIINRENRRILGLSDSIFYPKKKDIFLVFPLILKYSFHLFSVIKWNRLYRSLGVKLITTNKLNIFEKSKLIKTSINLYKKITTKDELIELEYDGIQIGDLIYDSYLRFNKVPTVNVRDFVLIIYIYKAIYLFEKVNKISSLFERFFLTYTSYINHGIPARIIKNNNTLVYTLCSFTKIIKKLEKNDVLHLPNYYRYNEDFKKLKNTNQKISLAFESLSDRFLGKNDLPYLKSSPFNDDEDKAISVKLDGVIFLHDFFDSPHCYRSMIFCDFYEWLLGTLKILEKTTLKIGIKPHPNNLTFNEKELKYFKSFFKNITWLSNETSNKSIFESGIKFGISNHGSVLLELAYHRITPISCGDNPFVDFDFVFTPKNKIDYKYLILNHSKLQFPKNLNEQIAIFYHMNYMNLSTDYYPIKIKSKSDKIMEMSFNRYNLTTKDLLIDKIF